MFSRVGCLSLNHNVFSLQLNPRPASVYAGAASVYAGAAAVYASAAAVYAGAAAVYAGTEKIRLTQPRYPGILAEIGIY